MFFPYRNPKGARASKKARGDREISKLSVVRLNEPENLQEVAPWPPPGGLPPGEDPFAKEEQAIHEPSFLLPGELEKPEGFRLTKERAVSLSIILHLLLALVLVTVRFPERKQVPLDKLPDPLGLIKMLSPTAPPPIPIQFFPAPGPKAPAPGKNPLPSDANRVAHGGDPKLPKMEQPRAVAQPGIQDLAAGKRGETPVEAKPAAAAPEDPLASTNQGYPQEGVMPRPEPFRLRGLPQSTVAGLTAEQAARAARESAGSGDEGGGFEHEGGFADSGPLSFDTIDYDWGAYAAAMIRRIKLHWDVPSLARYGMKGRVTIRFFIEKDGRVTGETILASSGIPPFDNAAFQAIATSSKFKPLPDDLGHDREGVTVTFFYNTRPEDEAPARRPLLPKGAGK